MYSVKEVDALPSSYAQPERLPRFLTNSRFSRCKSRLHQFSSPTPAFTCTLDALDFPVEAHWHLASGTALVVPAALGGARHVDR